MRVIAFASRKGGVGKTTLVGHLAVEAERRGAGPVALIDTDPQGSLAAWWNQRSAETPLFVGIDVRRLDQQLNELRNHGVKLVMIDTPPTVDHIEKVIMLADVVLVPVRPSPHDLRSIATTVDLIEAANKRMAFIVNGASVNSRISNEAVVALAEHSRAAGEIGELWEYVQRLLPGVKKKSSNGRKDDTLEERLDRP